MKRQLLLVFTTFLAMASFADVKLPQIFTDNMVLQRNVPIPVWGWAAPGEKVTVSFNRQTKTVKAGANGKWMVTLGAELAGGPFVMMVKGKNSLSIRNVLVGEVWICSGQSNMEMQVKQSSDHRYAKDISEANDTLIRHFKVKRLVSDSALSDVSGDWKIANDSNNVANFTSVGYFFAKKLEEELHVPVGLINSSYGGTCVESWMSPEAVAASEELKGVKTKTYAEVEAAAAEKHDPNVYPSLLYNAMISPLVPFAIKGVIWYQGESNADRARQYAKTFPEMITDWRAHWKQGDFPFYFVQLASWNAANGNSNRGSSWAELREAQTSTLSLPNTGMAMALDIGDSKDIHPANKKDVGLRLAAIALDKLYGKHGEYSGPVYESMSVDGDKAILSFSHADGLWAKDNYGYLKGFEIAGKDQQFHYARAGIKDGKVIVYSDSVASPVAVRYGWADDMPEANLYNAQDFPAVPFRTDNWKAFTEGKKYAIGGD